MMDDRVASYVRFNYGSMVETLHGRTDCRDYLRAEITRHDSIYGVLFMRGDGSLFSVLPEGNFFFDRPGENPLPEAAQAQILGAPLGQTAWVGPLSAQTRFCFPAFSSSSRMTSVRVISVSLSMPFAALTRIVSGSRNGTRSRTVFRIYTDGTTARMKSA